jgi:hypothetical protein
MDAKQFCPDAKGKDASACLKKHEPELSLDCRVSLAKAREMVRQAKDACEPDIENFCEKVEPGEGRIVRCLKEHESKLSQDCVAKIHETKQMILPEAAPAK